jgi:hypothetical protein
LCYAATGGTQAAAYLSSTGILGLVNPSAERTKKNIFEVTDVLSSIRKSRGLVSFDYIDETLPNDQLGLIADDWSERFPGVCVWIDGKLHSIDYGKCSAIALSGIKELATDADTLRAQLAAAQQEINMLKERIAA